ncbi:MAG: hypothetical protein RLZZ70_155 [Candidatus Parcubacteria bacterium]|jgi:hypothetical protein
MAQEQSKSNRCAVLAAKILQDQDTDSLRAILAATATDDDRIIFVSGLLPQLHELADGHPNPFDEEFVAELVMRLRAGAERRLS